MIIYMWLLLLLVILLVILVLLSKEYNKSYGFKQGFTCENTQKEIENYPRKSIDIMFDATFTPECCPTPYSSSMGCLCPTEKDAGMIISRGGNRLQEYN